MRVLVTGGAGFIGSHLVDALLKQGHSVAVIDDLSSGTRENVAAEAEFYEADIRDREKLMRICKEFRPEAVSHQAAQMSVSRSVREPQFDAEVNILGLVNVAESAREAGATRMVFASSGGVLYGDVSTPAGEETTPHPQSPYGISKWAGERYLEFFHRQHGLSGIPLRYANVYGERQNPHGEAGVVAIFCTRLLRGEPATINGDGKYLRDYVHVSDVVRANVLALQASTSGVQAFNVGTAQGTDVNQLAEMLKHLCEHEARARGWNVELPALQHGPARAGDLRSNLVSFEKIRNQLGWEPEVDLESGLRRTVHWFAERVGSGNRPAA
jgi:UDP-glucose 4-epimerase